MAFIDYYKVLGVEKGDGNRDKKRHTVKWPGNTIPFESEQQGIRKKFKEINEARSD
jgi:curved DNA-binding protein CbpA